MKHANLSEEKKLWRQGYEFVVGLDEAGRGPLAGPVVAVAVMVNSKIKIQNTNSQLKVKNLAIKDSKKLTELRREEIYKIITNHPEIKWGIGVVSEKIIDRINILEATKLAMKKAVDNLSSICQSFKRLRIGDTFLILDGNFKIKSKFLQKSVIKADEKIFSCTAAGIIAKITRDSIMKALHKEYSQYGFDKHKGYGTQLHIKNLQSFGPCKIHRKTFYPVSTLVKREIA